MGQLAGAGVRRDSSDHRIHSGKRAFIGWVDQTRQEQYELAKLGDRVQHGGHVLAVVGPADFNPGGLHDRIRGWCFQAMP